MRTLSIDIDTVKERGYSSTRRAQYHSRRKKSCGESESERRVAFDSAGRSEHVTRGGICSALLRRPFRSADVAGQRGRFLFCICSVLLLGLLNLSPDSFY